MKHSGWLGCHSLSETIGELKEEIVRLNKIVEALMNRVELSSSIQGSDFNLFQTALMLEEEVKNRTIQVENVLSENEQISLALREPEAKYRALVDQSLVGITVIDQGKFSFTNKRLNEIFGYSADELRDLGPLDVAVEQASLRRDGSSALSDCDQA